MYLTMSCNHAGNASSMIPRPYTPMCYVNNVFVIFVFKGSQIQAQDIPVQDTTPLVITENVKPLRKECLDHLIHLDNIQRKEIPVTATSPTTPETVKQQNDDNPKGIICYHTAT